MNKKAFIGYFESADPNINNLLHEQVEAIKNVHDGKIVECFSDNIFNYNDVDEMLQEAIKNKCKEVVILVNKNINAKQLEEAINEEYYKQFENVTVATEYFDRLNEETIQPNQNTNAINTTGSVIKNDISNKILIICGCMIPDRTGEIDKYVNSISRCANQYNKNKLSYDIRYPEQKDIKPTLLVQYGELVKNCGYNKDYKNYFSSDESCCISVEAIKQLNYTQIWVPSSLYSQLKNIPEISNKVFEYNFDMSTIIARNKKLSGYLKEFNEKLKNLINMKKVDGKLNNLRNDLNNKQAIAFFTSVLGQYIYALKGEDANKSTRLAKDSNQSFEDLISSNYSNLGGDWKNSQDLQNITKFINNITSIADDFKKDKSFASQCSKLDKAFLLWNKHNEVIKFITDNYLK